MTHAKTYGDDMYDVPNTCPYCSEDFNNWNVGSRYGKYRCEIFRLHLLEHGKTINDYVREYENSVYCACGCGMTVEEYKVHSKSIVPLKYIHKHRQCWNKGLNKGNNKTLSRISKERTGKGNPRYGKAPWNKGLTKETCDTLMKMSEGRSKYRYDDRVRLRMSVSAYKRHEKYKHPMLGKHHSTKTKRMLREATIRQQQLWGDKVSSVEKTLWNFLAEKGVDFEIQVKYGPYLYDLEICVSGKKILVEVHGDYWHSYPKFIAESGKVDTIQIRNLNRDLKKEDFVKAHKKYHGLLVLWEHEINDRHLLEKKWKLRLKKLLASKRSVVGTFTTLRCRIVEEIMLLMES